MPKKDARKGVSGLTRKASSNQRMAKVRAAKQGASDEPASPASSSTTTPARVPIIPASSSGGRKSRMRPATYMGVQSAFYVLFFIIFNNLALNLAAKFIQLARLLGITLTHMSKNVVPKLLKAAATYYRNQLNQAINDANSGCIALMLDESTDVDNNKTLIVIVRMLRDNKPVELFLDNMVVHDGTAEGIVTTLLSGLETLGVNTVLLKQKLISIGTDGASVMCGRINGVGMQLRRAGYTRIIPVHCFAHRIDLVSKDYFNKKAPKNVQNVIKKCREIAVAVHTSSKSRKLFGECCDDFVVVGRKRTVPIIETTRWLAHYERTVSRCADLRKPLIKFFETHPQYDKNGLKSFLSNDKSFLLLSAVLEVIKIMTELSLQFQKADLTILEACKVIQNSEMMLKLCVRGGIRTSTEMERRALFMDVDDNEKHLENVKATVVLLPQIAKDMLNNIKIRFPRDGSDLTLTYAFELVEGYRVEIPRLQEMCDFFSIPGVVTFENRAEMLAQVTSIYPVLPPSTASCERGFSQVGLIKTKLRSSLKADTLSALLVIKINSDNDLETAPVRQLTEEWCSSLSAKKRVAALSRRKHSWSLDFDDDKNDNNKEDDDGESGNDDETISNDWFGNEYDEFNEDQNSFSDEFEIDNSSVGDDADASSAAFEPSQV